MKDMVTFQHNGVTYQMTEEQIEAAYRFQERRYWREDAESHLNWLVFGSEEPDEAEGEEAKQAFQNTYGISFEEAMGMLDLFIERFEDMADANVDTNTTWELAIKSCLRQD